jgi:predicted O-methyltransferase YrrM
LLEIAMPYHGLGVTTVLLSGAIEPGFVGDTKSSRNGVSQLTSSALAGLRALREVVHLTCSRGAGPTLRMFDLLTSVYDAELPRLDFGVFQQRLEEAGRTLPQRVLLHPHATGFGSGSIADMVTLASLVALLQPRQVLEFGTCAGASTWHLWANAAPDAAITTLDLPSGAHVAGSTDLDLQGIASRPWLPDDPRVRLIEVDSRDWAPDVRDVDFCFIDAGHSYECVKNDTEKALPLMRAGGVIVWHDASWRRDGYGVNRFLRELRASDRDVFLLDAGAADLCLLAALVVPSDAPHRQDAAPAF